MSSMKASIERAAELLDVPVDALTEYMLDRDPELASVVEDRRDRVVEAAIALGMEPTELLLAVVDIAREAAPDAGCQAHLADLASARGRADMREASAVTEATRAGVAIRALGEIRTVTSRAGARSAWERLSEVVDILNRTGH